MLEFLKVVNGMRKCSVMGRMYALHRWIFRLVGSFQNLRSCCLSSIPGEKCYLLLISCITDSQTKDDDYSVVLYLFIIITVSSFSLCYWRNNDFLWVCSDYQDFSYLLFFSISFFVFDAICLGLPG